MTIRRMDHVGVVVEDLAAARAFFEALGMEILGDEMTVSGDEVDRITAIAGNESRIAMMAIPDGPGRLELIEFLAPDMIPEDPAAPPNLGGLRHLCFNVDDLEASVERLRPHGGELVGEVVNYGDAYLLCYLRGPGGIIVELAQDL